VTWFTGKGTTRNNPDHFVGWVTPGEKKESLNCGYGCQDERGSFLYWVIKKEDFEENYLLTSRIVSGSYQYEKLAPRTGGNTLRVGLAD